MTASPSEAVVWHDVECGGYDADLPLWRELAAAADGPVLEIGAGTGRVALDLARRGYDVVALDRDAELLAALEARAHAADLDVATLCADARAFEVDRSFALCVVP
nr:class I SAM-dependent methyltransferase [Actinomycetota bacterium]